MPLPALKNDAPEWVQVLYQDIASTGSIAATARRVGVDRSGLSGFLNNTASSPYVKGTCSTAGLATKVMSTIGLFACPFLSEEYGEERKISGLTCAEYAGIKEPPTHNPRAMRHWRSCQGCQFKPRQALTEQKIPTPTRKIGRVGTLESEICPLTGSPQQAGIIDKVTLPLPVIGAPQVMEVV